MVRVNRPSSTEIFFRDGNGMKIDENVRINLKTIPEDSTLLLFLQEVLFTGNPEELLLIEHTDSYGYVHMTVKRKDILRLSSAGSK